MIDDATFLTAVAFWESAGRYLKRSSTYRENLLFLVFAGLIAGIWITLILWERYRHAHNSLPKPLLSLFEELCVAHQLGPQEVSLLTDAAQECHLPGPAHLFLQPECFDRLCTPGAPKADLYGQLRERLFGNLVESQ